MTDLREAMRQAVGAAELVAVDVPEWGEKVYIRALSVGDQLAISQSESDQTMIGVKVLLRSIVDENGERRLADEDLPLLLEQSFMTLMPLLTESAKQNGQTKEEIEAAIASFGTTPGKDSSSE